MGGVDYADQKQNEHRIPVKSRRWYRYLAFFRFETAMVNAYILRQLSPNHGAISQLDFRLELIAELLGNYSCCKRKQASTEIEVRDGKSHFPVHVTLNRCSYCASRGQRHRSSWGCALCAVALCAGCFEPYHTTWGTLAWIKMEGAKFKFSWLSQKLVYLTCSSNYCCKCFASSLLWNNLLKEDILTVNNVISSKMHICNQERESQFNMSFIFIVKSIRFFILCCFAWRLWKYDIMKN